MIMRKRLFMKRWKNIRNYFKDNCKLIILCMICVAVLFLIMQSESPCTDAVYSLITVVIVARSYDKGKRNKEKFKQDTKLVDYLENIRYEVLGNKSNILFSGCLGIENRNTMELTNSYYYRVFCGLYESYTALGSDNVGKVSDLFYGLQKSMVKELDFKQKLKQELSGLHWIILAAIPAISLVRRWVTANMNDALLYYTSSIGNLLKYGMWGFTLIIFLAFERLGEIKSEEYI